MPVVGTFRKAFHEELCSRPDCRHAPCNRIRDMQTATCLYCGATINPFTWVVDLRTKRMVIEDIWYAGFAHTRCYERNERPTTPRPVRKQKKRIAHKALRLRYHNNYVFFKDGRFPDPQPLPEDD